MNKLSEDLQLIIYKYKHQLDYKSVTDELLQAKLNVFFNISLGHLQFLYFLSKDDIKQACLYIDKIDMTGKHLLERIKYNIKNNNN